MALDKASLKTRIEAELAAQGFVPNGTYAWAGKMATAIANAVVDEIQANARCSGIDSGADSHDAVQIV
ncbi:MAG: hypothetical protein ACYC5N_11410 [Endomicrobiales bacterium]